MPVLGPFKGRSAGSLEKLMFSIIRLNLVWTDGCVSRQEGSFFYLAFEK